MKMSKLNSPNLLLPNLSPSKIRSRVYNQLFKTKKSPVIPEVSKKPDELIIEDTLHASLSEDELDVTPHHCPSSDCEVIYKGAKTFWRSRATLEIILVSHREQKCIEVIGYNAKTDVEGPRIYIDSAALLSKFDTADIEARAENEKENRIRCRKSFDWDSLICDVRHQLMVQFITSRLNISPLENNGFDLFLVQSYSDRVNESTGKIDIICEKPVTLKPFPSDRKRVVPLDEMRKFIDDIDKDTKTVGKHFATVHKLVTEARSILGFHRGRDDSFAFLSAYRQRKSGDQYRRSIEDGHALENTVLGSALKKVREMIHLGSESKIAGIKEDKEKEEEIPAIPVSDPFDVEHTKNCDLLRVNGPALSSPKKFQRHKSHSNGLKVVRAWNTMSNLEDLTDSAIDTGVTFAPEASLSPREEVSLPPLKGAATIAKIPIAGDCSGLKRQSSSPLKRDKSIVLKKSKSRRGLTRTNSRKTSRRPSTRDVSSRRIVPVNVDVDEGEDESSVPGYARLTLARKRSMEEA